MAMVSSACGTKTSRAVRELQQERGWKGVMAESKGSSSTVSFGRTRSGDLYPNVVSHVTSSPAGWLERGHVIPKTVYADYIKTEINADKTIPSFLINMKPTATPLPSACENDKYAHTVDVWLQTGG